MNALNEALCHRAFCSLHLLNRIDERDVGLKPADIGPLEEMIRRMRPVFERPDQDRYTIRVKRSTGRIRVVYDTRLQILITAWGR